MCSANLLWVMSLIYELRNGLEEFIVLSKHPVEQVSFMKLLDISSLLIQKLRDVRVDINFDVVKQSTVTWKRARKIIY